MNIQDILGAGAQTQTTRGKGEKELGQQDFLKLLVAQMQNQDPSNPSDNAQFLSQIAQFSMVDGIDKLGTSFEGISGNYFTNQAMSAGQLVGREVLIESDTALLQEDGKLQGLVHVPEFADAINVQIRDAQGRLVKTLDTTGFKQGNWKIDWNGMNESEAMQPPGQYTVVATALVDGKHEALPVALFNMVESITVNRNSNSVELQLANKDRVNFSSVYEYR